MAVKRTGTKKYRKPRKIEAVLERDWYTLEECARFMGLANVTVYRMVADGKLKGEKVGKSWRFNKDYLKEFSDAQKVNEPKPEEYLDCKDLKKIAKYLYQIDDGTAYDYAVYLDKLALAINKNELITITGKTQPRINIMTYYEGDQTDEQTEGSAENE